MQIYGTFLKELMTKLIPMILKSTELRSQKIFNCENEISNVANALSSDGFEASITSFEQQFRDNIISAANVVQYQPDKAPYSIEYYLNLMMIGRDGPIVLNETPIPKELASIDNAGLSLINNATLAPPRRFLRLGIAPVIFFSLTTGNNDDVDEFFISVHSVVLH